MPCAVASIDAASVLVITPNGDVLHVTRTTHKDPTISVRLLTPHGISSVAIDGEGLTAIAGLFGRAVQSPKSGHA